MFRHSPFFDALVCAILCVPMLSISNAGDAVQGDDPDSIVARLTTIESDMAAIEGVLGRFNEAVRANDQEAALAQINPDVRHRFVGLIDALGSNSEAFASNWEDLTPLEIDDEIAIYAVSQVEDGTERLYTIIFVRHPRNLGG